MEIRLRADIARLQRDMNEIRRITGDTLSGIDRAVEATKSALKGLVGIAALTMLARDAINAQREFDKLNATLVTATASTANAAQAFKALQAFAATTPYSLKEATEGFIKMRNMGLDPSEKALRSYGNMAAAMGKDLNQMIEAVADAATSEFERMKEFGIRSKKNGDEVALTFRGVTTVVKDDAKAIEGYLQHLGEVNFGGSMELRAATLDGAISNLGDTWQDTMRTIAQNGIGDTTQSGVMGLTGALTDLSAILDAVAGAAKNEGEAVKELAPLHKALTTVFEAVAVLGTNVFYVLQQVTNELGGLAAQAAAVASGDLAGAKAIGDMMKVDAEEARIAIDAKTEAILGAAAKAQKAAAAEAAAKKAGNRDDLARYKTVLTAAEEAADLERKHAEFRLKYATKEQMMMAELKKQRNELGATFTAEDEALIRKHFAETDKGATKAAAAASQEKAAYQSLITSIHEKIAAGKLEMLGYDQLSEAQKMGIKLDAAIGTGKNKLSEPHIKLARNLIAVVAAQDLVNASNKFYAEQAEARLAADGALIQSAQDEADRNVELAKTFGLTKTAIEAMELARLREQLAQADSSKGYTAEIAKLEELIHQRERSAKALASIDGRQAGVDQSKRLGVDIPGEFGKVEDPFKNFGSTLRATFDSAGDGLQKMADAMAGLSASGKNYEKEMQVINDLRATKDPGNMAMAMKNEQKLIETTKNDQLGAYANMAGAAKSYFDEKSDAYRLLNGLEAGMHMMQMANQAQKLFGSLFGTTAEVTAKTAGNALVATSGVASDAVQLPGAIALASARAVGAVANQGGGDPYTAFARIAAMIGIMAGIGLMVGGGGSSSAPTVSMDAFAAQKANDGTGSVLGDPGAKSESIQNSLDALEGYAKPGLLFTSQMVGLLRSINTSLSGATNSLLQSGFDAFGSDFKGSSTSSGGGIAGAIFGSSSSSSTLSDLGLAFADQTIAAAMQSIQLKKYQVTRTDSESSGFLGFGSSSHTSYNTQMSAVDDKVARSMTMATQQMFDLVEKAASQIGASQQQIDAIKTLDTGLGKISLKDKTGQEIEELLNAVFSKMGDSMATIIAPGIVDMQKAGEGYLETLVRVTNGLSITNTWSRIFGRSLLDVSIAGATAANQLADAFGGLDALIEQSEAFYSAYYTQAEQAANSQLQVSEALASVNLAMPQTKTELRNLADALSQDLTPSGMAAYAMLLSIAPEFSDTAELMQELAADTAEKLMEAFTGRGLLVPALDVTTLKTLLLKDTLISTYTAAGNISTLFLDVNSGLISFGTHATVLTGDLTGAQLAANLLQREIVDLGIGASGAVLDIAAIGNALANVNTETFVTTMGLVFENLAERIGSVIDDIGSERIALREAALQIINPTVMSKAAIQRGIAGINTALPSNAAAVAAALALSKAQAKLTSAESIASPARAAANATLASAAAARDALAGILQQGVGKYFSSYFLSTNAQIQSGDLYKGTQNDAGFVAQSQYGSGFDYSSAEDNFFAKSRAAAQAAAAAAPLFAAEAAAKTAQQAALKLAMATQLAYADALQDFTIDASKSVSKLSKLREETVKYYDAQKQLADLMTSSADSLRGTVADIRYSTMTDAQQFDSLQASYATAYSMALSTDGEALAGYGSTLNSALNPLLEKAKEVLSGSSYAAFASTAIARAEAIAARLETLTPTNYQADSLAMLSQIDVTLAALDASSKSAERIISDAIGAGADKTSAGLHAVIAALTGQAIPAFAMGGDHTGGLRLVGENSPELEVTGPSRIFNASQTRGMLSGGSGSSAGNTARLEALVEQQNQELIAMRAELRAIAVSNAKMARLADRVYVEGALVRTDADMPLTVVA